MKLYLISGKAGHGKDTFANILKDQYENLGKKVCSIQYSTYIKLYATKYFGWDGKEETKPRELLQKLGTEIIRQKIDPLFHVNRILQDIEVLSYFFDVGIISDVRAKNEIVIPKQKFSNAVSIKIFRPNFETNLTGKEQKHFTEVDLDNFKDYDYEILNDKTIEDLYPIAKSIIEKEMVKDGEKI